MANIYLLLGKMTFPDFYPGEVSPDGKMWSFLSREGTRAYREKLADKGTMYFKGKCQYFLSIINYDS